MVFEGLVVGFWLPGIGGTIVFGREYIIQRLRYCGVFGVTRLYRCSVGYFRIVFCGELSGVVDCGGLCRGLDLGVGFGNCIVSCFQWYLNLCSEFKRADGLDLVPGGSYVVSASLFGSGDVSF